MVVMRLLQLLEGPPVHTLWLGAVASVIPSKAVAYFPRSPH